MAFFGNLLDWTIVKPTSLDDTLSFKFGVIPTDSNIGVLQKQIYLLNEWKKS